MADDNNEELKKKIEKLETQDKKLIEEIKELKKQLKENTEWDIKRHKEIKQLQEDHHKENLVWNKLGGLGALATPATILLTLLASYLKKKNVTDNNGESKAKPKESKTDLSGIAEIIREVKK